MSTFQTLQPISVTLELVVANVRIAASERTDTIVEVRPTSESNEHDVKAAQQTRVEYANGALLVKSPKPKWRGRDVGSIELTIELPAGSTLNGAGAMIDLSSAGRLGESRFTAAAGHIRLDKTGSVNLDTAAGGITVDEVSGNAHVTTGSGEVRLGTISGSAVVKNSNGQTWVGQITGDVRVNSANGSITVDKAGAGVEAKTANGNVTVGEVVRGSVGLESAMGELEVGIREGTAAWLDAKSAFGTVRSSLDPADAPTNTDETVEVRARTSFGDILVHRS